MEPKDMISLLAQILIFAGFIFAIIKFAVEKQREFKKRFFEEQLRTYTEVVDNASCITLYQQDSEEYKKAVLNFKRLFWGKMCIVEDRNVESAMVSFSSSLKQYESSSTDKEENKIILQDAGLVLAHTCRNSILRTWGINDKLEDFNNYTLKYPANINPLNDEKKD
jgi:hypothetical protein